MPRLSDAVERRTRVCGPLTTPCEPRSRRSVESARGTGVRSLLWGGTTPVTFGGRPNSVGLRQTAPPTGPSRVPPQSKERAPAARAREVQLR